MIIVWSGWGIQVPLYVIVAFVLAAIGIAPLHLTENLSIAIDCGLAGAVAGGAIYLTARWIETKPGRVLIDAATQRSFEVKPSAGSFFFVPTRFWAFIVPLLGFLAAGVSFTSATTPPL